MADLVNEVLLNSALWIWGGTAGLLIFFARGRRWRMVSAAIFLAGLWFSGTAPFARLVLGPLETRYAVPTVAELAQNGVKRVVVLTGGGVRARRRAGGERAAARFDVPFFGGHGVVRAIGTGL